MNQTKDPNKKHYFQPIDFDYFESMIDSLLKKKEIESISEFFSDGSLELNAARLKSEGKVPFGKLRMVQAWLMSNK